MNTLENIMENESSAPKEQIINAPFSILKKKKYMIFQRRQKALLWSKELKCIKLYEKFHWSIRV